MRPPAVADVGAGLWTPRASVAGGGRLEAAVVALDDRLLLLGGFDRELEIVARVDAYDPESNAWAALAAMPVPLTHINVAAVDGKLYVLGGLAGVDFAGSGAAFRYDPAADAWNELSPLPAVAERGASGVAVVDGTKVVLAGGTAGALTLSSVLAYDVPTDTWSELPELPTPRSHVAAAMLNGTLVLAGGLAGTMPSTRPSPWSTASGRRSRPCPPRAAAAPTERSTASSSAPAARPMSRWYAKPKPTTR